MNDVKIGCKFHVCKIYFTNVFLRQSFSEISELVNCLTVLGFKISEGAKGEMLWNWACVMT